MVERDARDHQESSFDLKAFLAERKEQVDQALQQCLPTPAGLEKNLLEASRYSLFAGGKRLRPILCLQAAEVAGRRLEGRASACGLALSIPTRYS